MIDTGASSKSTADYSQFLAFQKISNAQLDPTTYSMISVQLGIGSTTSIGSVMRQGNNADITVLLKDENGLNKFKESRQIEILGLIEKGVFKTVKFDEVPAGTRLLDARFFDEIKHKGTDKAFEKSRLVVQAYNDREKGVVLTQSPTIQRINQRLIFCIATLMQTNDVNLYLREISQAYVQSITKLNRNFYIKPPQVLKEELGLAKDTVLKVVKPLYGVSEDGNHWGELTNDRPIKYNGCVIQKSGSTIELTQKQQCKNLKLVFIESSSTTSSRGAIRTGLTTKEQYVAQRARGAYVDSMCQSGASSTLSFAAQVTNPNSEDIKALNNQ
ncbi:hypothetical protein EPUL_004675 [Erysiphe pulchra]|uniref:Uncharacterized protein n=1 Tax=Erysiphe pulchra TaxID=225359 RepID=A0A2S4PN24_9PEZI|nr:hypothetical protein EPUL_004675 [Erysiphe pulchra]